MLRLSPCLQIMTMPRLPSTLLKRRFFTGYAISSEGDLEEEEAMEMWPHNDGSTSEELKEDLGWDYYDDPNKESFFDDNDDDGYDGSDEEEEEPDWKHKRLIRYNLLGLP